MCVGHVCSIFNVSFSAETILIVNYLSFMKQNKQTFTGSDLEWADLLLFSVLKHCRLISLGFGLLFRHKEVEDSGNFCSFHYFLTYAKRLNNAEIKG